jgi:hypothetical protein
MCFSADTPAYAYNLKCHVVNAIAPSSAQQRSIVHHINKRFCQSAVDCYRQLFLIKAGAALAVAAIAAAAAAVAAAEC